MLYSKRRRGCHKGVLLTGKQVKGPGFTPQFRLPAGRLGQGSCTLFGSLHIDFFFAVGYTYLAVFRSSSSGYSFAHKILACILIFSKNSIY